MLALDLYSGAVIRLATLQKKQGQAGQLLFATLFLLPRGRQRPPSMVGIDRLSIGKTGESIFFRRVYMTARDAVEWYLALGGEDSKSPIPSRHEERNSKYDGIEIRASRLTDDPPWPYIGLPIGQGLFSHPSGRNHPAPFIGNSPARVHRRFGSQDGFSSMLSNDEAVAFAARRLHVDLRLYREYLGSIALVAPDPVLKQIDNFMIPASDSEGERIFYRFVPRVGVSLTNLKITTFDEQAHLLTDFSTQDIPCDGILDIDKGNCTGSYGYVVTHSPHGVLAYSPPYPFLRQINISAHVGAHEIKKVSVPIGDSVDSPLMEYTAGPSSSPGFQSTIGDDSRIPGVNARIAHAAASREKFANAKRYGQRWFANGSRQEAMRFVHGELRRARERVIIADPFLAGLQLEQFLYAVDPQVESVTLLSSGDAFRSKGGSFVKIDDFSRRLVQLKDAKVTVNAFVLQSSILHDRFLVVDDAVWFLGNSLNTLGVKASLIVKLPNADEVIEKLHAMLSDAIPFEDYKRRQAIIWQKE